MHIATSSSPLPYFNVSFLLVVNKFLLIVILWSVEFVPVVQG